METLFKNSGVGGSGAARFYGDEEDGYESQVRAMIEDSVDFEESYLAKKREDNQAYYNGLQPAFEVAEEGGEEPVNRSTFVSTDVRDTILTVMPSLIRIFASNDEDVVEFVPQSEAMQDMADQCRDYLNYVFFEDNPGFLILHAVFKDSMTVKAGITKWWTDTDHEVKEHTFQNITQEQYQYIVYEMPEVEVLDMADVDPQTGLIPSVTFRHVVSKPQTKLAAVPPDEFRISRDAKDVESAGLVGHECIVPISALVKKGYDPDELRDYLSTQISYSDERFMRNPGLTDDKMIEGVLYGEWYIRVDGDGDGVDELRHICTVGEGRIIVDDSIVPYTRFALWGCDPVPHTAIGDCLADITKDIQRFKTNMMRGQIDNLAESITPRTVVNELVTNIEDVLNDEVGAVIRTRGDPNAAVAFSKTPYVGEEVQATINYMDQVRASRTGITEASKGLDPKAMQSTSLVGIDAIVSGAQERIELIARILAETGLKPTLKGLLREIVDNPNQMRTVKLRGKWVNVNPSLFDPTMRIQVNPTLGKGTDTVRLSVLTQIKETQTAIINQYGLGNPIVTVEEFLNTVEDILKLGNIKNFGRYFKRPDPDTLASIANAPKEPDPASVLAQAELEKVKKDTIVAMGKQDNDTKRLELQSAKDRADDDFRRDKLNVDAALTVLDIQMDPKPQSVTADEPSLPANIANLNQPG
jgi:hypothetical protein